MINSINQQGDSNKASININQNKKLLVSIGAALALALLLFAIHKFLGWDLRSYLPAFN